jgi:hypothetical protein
MTQPGWIASAAQNGKWPSLAAKFLDSAYRPRHTRPQINRRQRPLIDFCGEHNKPNFSPPLAEENMVQVTELGYMGVGIKQLDEWKSFATQILGMQLADDGERDRCYLRMDYWHHRLVLHDNGTDDLEYLGFRVAGAAEFYEMQHQLETAGIKFRVGSEDEAAERRRPLHRA